MLIPRRFPLRVQRFRDESICFQGAATEPVELDGPNVDAGVEKQYTIKAVVGHRFLGARGVFKVRWCGRWGRYQETWEPLGNFSGSGKRAVARYVRALRKAERLKSREVNALLQTPDFSGRASHNRSNAGCASLLGARFTSKRGCRLPATRQ